MLSALIWIPVWCRPIGFWPGSLNPSRSRLFALVVTGITLIWTVVLEVNLNLVIQGYNSRSISPD